MPGLRKVSERVKAGAGPIELSRSLFIALRFHPDEILEMKAHVSFGFCVPGGHHDSLSCAVHHSTPRTLTRQH